MYLVYQRYLYLNILLLPVYLLFLKPLLQDLFFDKPNYQHYHYLNILLLEIYLLFFKHFTQDLFFEKPKNFWRFLIFVANLQFFY